MGISLKWTTALVAVILIIIFLQFLITTSIFESSLMIEEILLSSLSKQEHFQKMRRRAQEFLDRKGNIFDLKFEIENLPKWDFKVLNNFTNFKFSTFNNACNGFPKILLLIMVNSAPKNVKNREVIRKTWGALKNRDIRLLFLLGAVPTPMDQQLLEQENRIHRDLLQGNFMDSYNNLTYKTIMGFKFALYYCQNAQYILKADDDVFIFMEPLKFFLEKRANLCGTKNYIQCGPRKDLPVHRSYTKWNVPFQSYPNSVYPEYCLGNYPTVLTMDVVFKLYKESQKGDFFSIEDAYLTGIIRERLALGVKSFLPYTLSYWETQTIIWSNGTNGRRDFLFGMHSLEVDDILHLGLASKNTVPQDIFIDSC